MRRLGVVFGLLMVSLLAWAPAVDAAGPPAQPAAEGETKTKVDAAYVKVTLTKDGKTYAHPGFRVNKDEAGVFVIECGGKNHEIAVLLREGDEQQLSVNVEYTVDGQGVLTEDLTVEAGKDTTVGKGATKLAINVDPRGKKDTSRKDEDKLDGPDSDDPLGGLK